jgi:hypothetical protein
MRSVPNLIHGLIRELEPDCMQPLTYVARLGVVLTLAAVVHVPM